MLRRGLELFQVKLDINPDKAWINDNMFVPSAYHLDASVEGGSKSPEERGDTPFIYPAGMGQVLMNGCWGKDYKIGDPCYNAKLNSTICWVSRDAIATIQMFSLFKDCDVVISVRFFNDCLKAGVNMNRSEI